MMMLGPCLWDVLHQRQSAGWLWLGAGTHHPPASAPSRVDTSCNAIKHTSPRSLKGEKTANEFTFLRQPASCWDNMVKPS